MGVVGVVGAGGGGDCGGGSGVSLEAGVRVEADGGVLGEHRGEGGWTSRGPGQRTN